jgi:hypothetical protein
MLKSGRSKIAQYLRGMLVDQLAAGLQLDDRFVFDEQISKKLAERRTVLIINTEGMLLPYGQAAIEKTVSQRVLVDLLEMSVPEIAMSTERGFANHCAELKNLVFIHGT